MNSKTNSVTHWLRTAFAKKRTWFFLAIVAVLGGTLLGFQGPRCCLYGWLRFEPTYRGLPASYWRAVLLDQYQPGNRPQGIPDDTVTLLWRDGLAYYDRHWSLGSQTRHLLQGDPQLSSVLLRLLQDDDNRVRLWAIDLLCQQGCFPDEAESFLVELLEDQDPTKRWTGVLVSGRLGPKARGLLPQIRSIFAAEQFDDPKIHAALAIKQIDPDDQESLRYLIGLIDRQRREKKSPNITAGRAAVYLGMIGPGAHAALPDLVELAKDSDGFVAQSAFNAIMRIDPEVAEREGLVDSKNK